VVDIRTLSLASPALEQMRGAGEATNRQQQQRQHGQRLHRLTRTLGLGTLAAGFGTNLAPTFTVGTGFFGRSSIGENLGPQHLVHWTRVAFGAESRDLARGVTSASFPLPGPLPEAPSDGLPGKSAAMLGSSQSVSTSLDPNQQQLREEIRRVIAEELRLALKG